MEATARKLTIPAAMFWPHCTGKILRNRMRIHIEDLIPVLVDDDETRFHRPLDHCQKGPVAIKGGDVAKRGLR